jgi:spoIIIJ-associated protein
MDANEFDGKDLEDALAAAVDALGRPASELDYEILEGGRKGVFGLGARPVRIRVAVVAPMPPLDVTPRPSPRPKATRERGAREQANREQAASSSDSLPRAALGQIISKMGFDLRIEESRRDGTLELTLDGPDRKTLAARDGELLSAIEFVLNRMGRRAWPDEPSVRLVCRGFRSERDDELILMVKEAAAQVARSGVPRRLHAMNPYERRVVHMTVRELPGMTTVSEGDGFLKRVRVEKLAR